MELKQLMYFLHVAELGSFTRAERQLSVAQPALSRQIRALEDELKQRLFERHGRGVVLTEAGQQLLGHAQQIVKQVERARSDVSRGVGDLTGECRIAVPPTTAMLLTVPLAREFERRAPLARLVLHELPSPSVLEWISQGRLDFGLAHNAPEAPSFEATPLLIERMYLIGPAGSPESELQGVPIAVRDIPRYRLIVPSARQSPRMILEAEMGMTRGEMNVAWEAGSTRAILDLVEAGMGFAILSLGTVSRNRAAFFVRPIVEPELNITLSSVVPTRRPLTRLATCVHEIVTTLMPTLAVTNV